MQSRRVSALLMTLVAGAAITVAGQGSPFGIRGLGIPARFESVRARATGGGFAAFDELSVLNDASIAGITRITAAAAVANSYLTDDLSGAHDTRRIGRFPLFQVVGPVRKAVVFGGGFAAYLDRSYRVVIQDTITLSGSPQAVTDVRSSDGGVTDLRFAAAKRFARLTVGVGLHLLTGSTRELALRVFTDTSIYRSVSQAARVSYHGVGYSAGVTLRVKRDLLLAGYWRADGRLASEVSGTTVATHDLPMTIGAAVRWQPVPQGMLAASVTRRSWGSGADSGAFNTTSWSGGVELGSARLPLRLGVRGGEVPFGPGESAPHELAVAAGSGVTLAGGRGVIDFAVERLRRTGDGLTEGAWTILIGLAVRP